MGLYVEHLEGAALHGLLRQGRHAGPRPLLRAPQAEGPHRAGERDRGARRVLRARPGPRDERRGPGRRLSPNTRSGYVSSVRSFFAFLEARHLLLVNPAKGVPLPARRRLPRAIGQGDVRRLLEAPSAGTIVGQRDRAVLELLYGTGLRLMECVRLDLADVDLARGTVLVRNGKGRKDRFVPITGRARAAIETYLREARPALTEREDDRSLFVSRHGTRLGGMSIRAMVRRYGLSVGVKLSTHVLRHSYATHLLQGGADVRHVQELLGHKDVSTTALYTKVDTSILAKVLRRCHPRERALK